MSTATIAGRRVTHARAYLPAYGVWWAELSLDEEVQLSGRVTLQLADLKLSGTVMSGGPGPKGRSSYRLAAGAGAWGKTVPAKSYANDAAVKASTVIVDAALACGETLVAATVPVIRPGPSFVRESAPASRVLEQLFPAGWYVGEDGATRIGRRPKTVLQTSAQIETTDRARQTVRLSAESIATILPGVVVDGVEAVDVLHELAPGALRTRIWGAEVATAALRRIFEQLDPNRKFRGTYEYRVVTQDGERLNLQPVRVSTGMPDLQRVFVRPGVAGARCDIALGARVLVTFVDADPLRPCVVGFEDAEGDGFLPTKLKLNASTEVNVGAGVLAAARMTDPIQAGPFVGTITAGSTKVKVG